MRTQDGPTHRIQLLLPPYRSFTCIREADGCDDRGVAVVWAVSDGEMQKAEWDWLLSRPLSVSLIIVLPPASVIRKALPMLRDANALRPRGVLPNSALADPEPVRLVLASAPRDLPSMAIDHFMQHGLLRNQRIRALVGRVFELAPTVPSISKLARKLYTSRRTLGRYFEAEGLPVPSHWLQLARLVHVAAHIQDRRNVPIFRAAIHIGYPDGFTMSNQMKRLIGCRPTDVRENLGLSWLLEEWIEHERVAGRLSWQGHATRLRNTSAWLREHPLRRSA